MKWTQGLFSLPVLGLSLLALGAQAEDDPTMIILPEDAADQAKIITENVVLPDEAADGMATADASRGNGADAAADGLAEAQLHANEAAQEALQTAVDAVEGARGELGRAHMPDGLPEGVPENIPAVPEGTLPEGTDLPTPPAPPTPPIGG